MSVVWIAIIVACLFTWISDIDVCLRKPYYYEVLAGAVIALLTALCKCSIFQQIIVFCIVFIVGFSIRFMFKLSHKDAMPTNTDAIVGQVYKMTGHSDAFNCGIVWVADVTWRVKPLNGKPIKDGSLVRVLKVEGNILFVEEVSNISA